MRLLSTPRQDMIVTVVDAHSAAMKTLRAAYPGQASQTVLDSIDRLEVELSERLATRGGSAMMRRMGSTFGWYRIKLNARLLADNPTELIPTYLHELAHIVANLMMNSNCGHGPVWAAVMLAMGQTPRRCHDMNVSAYRKAPVRYSYTCAACSKQFCLTPHEHGKHNRSLLRGSSGYRCQCGGALAHYPKGRPYDAPTKTLSG